MSKKAEILEQIRQLFIHQYCWTIDTICQKLSYSGTSMRRFIKELGYFNSFTQNSKWYTLASIPRFNKDGLWFHQDIGFSKHGNLNETIVYLINKNSQGLSAKQLKEKLSVPCHAVLNHLYNDHLIHRLKSKGGFIYLSGDEKTKQQQLRRLELSQKRRPTTLTAQAAVYVLVEFIKQPQASFAELSKAVAKNKVIVQPEEIARFFEEHDLKKTLG